MIDLFKEAVLLIDLPEHNLEKGDVGVVVEIHRNHEGYEVEFMTKEGRTIAVETLMANQVRAIGKRDVWHVRELQEAA
ncbi:MAG: DUF4926 domain-containing protein [Rudanella sp.]|nr:DUF4926 domain-containing protein [Rudanella sp.]